MAKKKNNLLKSVPETELTGLALKHWNKIMPNLVADGMVNNLDIPIIESACEVYAQYQEHLGDEEASESPLAYLKVYVGIMEKYGATAKARHSMKMAEPNAKSDKKDRELLDAFGGM